MNLTIPEVDHSKDGESQAGYIISVVTIMCILSTTAVALRLYTRTRVLRVFGADDAVMAVAQVLTLGSAVAIFMETAYGLGRHTSTISAAAFTSYLKSFYSSIVVYNVATCVVKMSILLQYRRIFCTNALLLRRLTLAGLVFEAAWALTLAVLLPLVCQPVAAYWDTTGSIQGAHCLDQLAIWYVMASVNLVTDFVVFGMPLPVIHSLQLPRRQRIMLMAVFGLGFFTCIISIYRISTLRAAAGSADSAWDNTGAAVWSFIELSVGVLAACLPTLKPLLAGLAPRLFQRSSVARGGTTSGGDLAHHHHHHQLRYYATMSGKGGDEGGWGSRSKKYGSEHPVKDVDGDLEALREHARPGGSVVDLPVYAANYNCSVEAGRLRGAGGSGSSAHSSVDGSGSALDLPSDGIKTTTVVTQRVDSL